MKRNILLGSILAFTLTACGGGGDSSSSTAKTDTTPNDSINKVDSTPVETPKVVLVDNSNVALSMPNLNNDSSTPLNQITK